MAFPTSKTLKEYYVGEVDHTETSSNWGYTLQMWDCYENGVSFITGNLATLQTDIRSNAIMGKQQFTLSYAVSYQVANLRLLGPHFESFKAGVLAGLQAQAVYYYECAVSLNTSDINSTKIDLKFDFCP